MVGHALSRCGMLFVIAHLAACGGTENASSKIGDGGPGGIASGSGNGATSGSTGNSTGAASQSGAPTSAGTSSAGPSGSTASGAGAATDGGAGSPVDAGPPGADSGVTDPGSAGDGDFTIGPNYTPDPLETKQGAPAGKVISYVMQGTESKIYPGLNGNYVRHVEVYVPAQYVPGAPAPFIVTQDAMGEDLLPTILDNLIAAKMLPTLVVLFVDNGGGDAVGSERGLEYDTVSGLYAEFVQTEVLPRAIMEVKSQLGVDLAFTDDPQGRATLGGSSGGAASFSMAWWHPDLFNRVLTYSGTYVNQVPASSPFPHGCWVYHDVDPYDAAAPNGLIVQDCEGTGDACATPLSQSSCEAVMGCMWNTTVNKPLRVWLESAQNDLGAGGAPSSYRNFDLANQRMAAALQMRGYHYVYNHALNAGHVDSKVVAQTLPSALLWLWRGYPIP